MVDTDDHVKLSELMEKDKIHEYAVNEGFDDTASLHKDGFGFGHKITNSGTHEVNTSWKWPLVVSTLIIVFFLFLVIVLQSVTIYNLLNDTANEATPVTDSVIGTTDTTSLANLNLSALCDNYVSGQMDLMQRLNNVVSQIESIVSNTDMQTTYIQNNTDSLEQNLAVAQQSAQKLIEVTETLANVKDTGINSEGIITDILLVAEQLLRIQNSTEPMIDPSSCQDILNSNPQSPSGYYHIHSQIMYCKMEELCGSEGGWTRLGYLDMTDSTNNCPSGFTLFQANGIRGCGRSGGGGGSCSSVKFESNGITYTDICGRVLGYQLGTTDGVDTRFISAANHANINSFYVDGVSITQGYPREHIWTYIAGFTDSSYSDGNCPCNNPPGATQDLQPFIGNNYYCESGNPSGTKYYFITSDVLWDGEDCGTQEGDCCAPPNLPWFNRTVNATTDYLELRVCADQSANLENVPVSFYELYVK